MLAERLRDSKAGENAPRPAPGGAAAWQALLERAAAGNARAAAPGHAAAGPPEPPEAAPLFDLYLPFCAVPPGRSLVFAHLGQSLDGRIATSSGASRWVTGEADIAHNHRMRALADAVIIGAGTLRSDDPQLTVRACPGRNPVRVVLDGNLTLDERYGVFQDGAAPTLLFVAEDAAPHGTRHGTAEIVALPRRAGSVAPADIVAELARRGLVRLFVEGGGVTVSRFLAADCLDRLQLTVSPLLIGSGRPSISLPEITDLRHGVRPRVRRFELGPDLMFECILR